MREGLTVIIFIFSRAATAELLEAFLKGRKYGCPRKSRLRLLTIFLCEMLHGMHLGAIMTVKSS